MHATTTMTPTRSKTIAPIPLPHTGHGQARTYNQTVIKRGRMTEATVCVNTDSLEHDNIANVSTAKISNS